MMLNGKCLCYVYFGRRYLFVIELFPQCAMCLAAIARDGGERGRLGERTDGTWQKQRYNRTVVTELSLRLQSITRAKVLWIMRRFVHFYPDLRWDEWEWAATYGALAAKSAAVSIDWLLNYPIQLEQA